MHGVGEEVITTILFTVVLAVLLYFVLRRRQRPQEQDAPQPQPPLQPPQQHRAQPEDCPICLDNLTAPLMTNCGHWFCGACFAELSDHSPPLEPTYCPMCRQRITLIMNETPEFHDRVRQYNNVYGRAPRTFWENFRDAPTLFRQVCRLLLSVDMPLIFRMHVSLTLLSAVLYTLLPVDLLPEAILGVLGLLDDLIIVLAALLYVGSLYRSFVLQR
eukprot:m.324480 g.324480  ORF g.324480 m.324480 type:complete len:216 (+) comp33501_c0_seq1:51-698(+)